MDKIEQAFETYPREEFLPESIRSCAQENRPLAIGFGQTNSQPSTVRQMLEWLSVQEGNKILDVGSGSGWTRALLSFLAGEKGNVFAVEAVSELVAMGQENCARLGIKNVTFHQATRTFGLPENAPYDKILVSASSDELPMELVQLLKPSAESKIVIPVEDAIVEVSKSEEGDVFEISHPGFLFVPLISISNPRL